MRPLAISTVTTFYIVVWCRCCVLQRSGASRLCVFRETLSTNHFTELRSVSDAAWRVGFKRNGRPMSATRGGELPRGRRRQRCFQFLKRGAERTLMDWRRRRTHPVPFDSVDHRRIVGPRLIRRRRRRRRVWIRRIFRAQVSAVATSNREVYIDFSHRVIAESYVDFSRIARLCNLCRYADNVFTIATTVTRIVFQCNFWTLRELAVNAVLRLFCFPWYLWYASICYRSFLL